MLRWKNILQDDDTGEVLFQRDNHIQNPYNPTNNTYNLWNKKCMVKLPSPCYRASYLELGRMTILATCLIKGNIVGKRTNTGYVPCNMNDIANILGMKERETKRFVGSMKKKRIIAKQGKAFIVNPAFFIRSGQEITGFMWQTFKEDLKNVIPASVQKEFEMRE